MEHITSSDFDEKVKNAGKPVVLDFYADWCGPCRMLAPIFQELSEEMGSISFFKVNVEEAADLASQFGVRSIPTLIVFKNGQEADRVMGLMRKDELKKMISGYL